jgi:integrase
MKVAINLDIDRPELEGERLDELVDHFLAERGRKLDPKTIKGYRIRLSHFQRWWKEEGPRREWVLGEIAFDEYAQYVKNRPDWNWHSRNDALRRLRQLLRWANQRGYTSLDFSEFVQSIRGNPKPILPVHLDVLRALLEACKETSEPERNRAILAVLAGTGIRCEECAALRVEDVVLYDDGSGLITLSVAKNDKLRTVAFDPDTAAFLCEWIVMLPYQRGPLFPSRNGRNSGIPMPLAPQGIYRIVRELADWGEVADKIKGPHDLRRMFATTWARVSKGEGHLLQKQMGHSSYSTTLHYILQDTEDVREAIAKKPLTPIALIATMAMSPTEIDPRAYARRVARLRQYTELPHPSSTRSNPK